MQIVSKRTLKLFWENNSRAEAPLRAWFALARRAEWKSPQHIKDDLGATVDFVGDNRVIFDIAGNRYRLVVRVSYRYKCVLIKFVGTHAEYDKIDPETV